MEAAIDIHVIERLTADERKPASQPVMSLSYLSTAEVADCTCPDWCERDHDRD